MYGEKGLRGAKKCDNILGVYTNVHDTQTRYRNNRRDRGNHAYSRAHRTCCEGYERENKVFYRHIWKKTGNLKGIPDKADIFPFRDNIRGKTLTFVLQMHDEPGLLSDVLKVVAEYGANIQTLHQSIPINGVATLTISVEVLATTGDISNMIETIESKEGIQYLKILARE